MIRNYTLGVFVAVLLTGCGSGQNSNQILPPGTAVPDHLPGQQTFRYTGTRQSFLVPRSVTEIKVVAIGGNGASDPRRYSNQPPSQGGDGGRVQAFIPVTPHEKLYIYVGGNASETAGGYNGGGHGSTNDTPDGSGGGGASDIREGGDQLIDRILVAGGGGGAGGDGYGYATGQSSGGPGGDLTGGSGGASSSGGSGEGGGGGTQEVGGNGGRAEVGCYYYGQGKPGSPGKLGKAGSGGNGGVRNRYGRSFGGGGGGGGGGGYYGGGAGGAGCSDYSSYTNSGGGGGGGSSYVEPSATNVRMWQGWKRTGHGLIVLSWHDDAR